MTIRNLNKILTYFILIASIQILCGRTASVEATQSYSVFDTQKMLSEKGYDSGPIDGIMGIKTKEALKKFQEDNHLPISGKLDAETEKKLFDEKDTIPEHERNPTISSKSTTTMKHTKPDFFVADQRIQLQAEVENPAGINLVRCYFKAAGEANMVFVPMIMDDKNEYACILPAPSKVTTQIEYLFLSVNSDKKIIRSQIFTITQNANKGIPAWQEISKQGEIKVSMEIGKATTELAGFSDDVTIDVVESCARFGVVAMMYHHISSATISSATASTGATSAGTITAGTAGYSTATIVGIGLGAAAAVGGTAVATNEAGGGDSDNGNLVECGTLTAAGGDTPETHTINLGQRSGTFNFSYETYSQEDRMIVTYEGNILFDTGCVGTSGTRTEPISYSGKSSNVTVKVFPNCPGGSGTLWNFTVNCPQ